MSLDIFTILFCMAGGLFMGTVGLAYKVLTTGCMGLVGRGMDRNDDGEIRIFSVWNMSLFAYVSTISLYVASRYPETYVAMAIEKVWRYGIEQGLIG